jgi:hypothetical protein
LDFCGKFLDFSGTDVPPPTRRPACFTQHQPSSSPAPSPDSSRPTRSQPLRAPQTSTLDEPLYPLSDQPLRHSPHRLRWLHRPAELEACPLLRPTWRSSTPIRAGPLLAPGFISWPACSTQRRVHQTNTTPPRITADGFIGANPSRPACCVQRRVHRPQPEPTRSSHLIHQLRPGPARHPTQRRFLRSPTHPEGQARPL